MAHALVAELELSSSEQPPLQNLELRCEDLQQADLAQANAFYAYLSPAGNAAVGDRLRDTAFAPGQEVRIVTCAFPLTGTVGAAGDSTRWGAREVREVRRSVMGLDLFLYQWTAQ